MASSTEITFEYVNYKGEVGIRRVIPEKIEFGLTPNIEEPEWLLIGKDLDKNAVRFFVMKHISKFLENTK